ncbi:MAG TPA: hypothetical protein PKC76_15170 [Saprospiraceae bacterium]|nr:hypothetical protein [Saprospiraceae bacterium]HMP25475.1 hypothetical protein [Saprospiraceae bacterium]
MEKVVKLNVEEFEKDKLTDNQLRKVLGGGTTWTDNDGGSGTDTCHGGGHTTFSDGSYTLTGDVNTCP